MLPSSGYFKYLSCPYALTCTRRHCHFFHGETSQPTTQSFDYSYSADLVAPSSSTAHPVYYSTGAKYSDVQIAQEPFVDHGGGWDAGGSSGSGNGGNYYGYYSVQTSASMYNPFSYDYAATPAQPAPETVAGGFTADDDDRSSPRPPPAPVTTTTTTMAAAKKRKRASTGESEDESGISKLPPEIGEDSILMQFSNAKPKSSKARRLTTKKPQPSAASAEANKQVEDYLNSLKQIDKQLAALEKSSSAVSKKKRPSVNVDDLFDVEEERPPKPPKEKPKPTAPVKASSKPVVVKKEPSPELVILDIKPDVSASRWVAHQPKEGLVVPGIKRRTTVHERLQERSRAVAEAREKLECERALKSQAKAPSSAPKLTATSLFTKNVPRTAHLPPARSTTKPTTSTKISSAPGPIDPSNRKFGVAVRQGHLNKLIAEFCKFMPRPDAVSAAQKEEMEILTKTATKQGYLTGLAGSIRRIREMARRPKLGAVSHSTIIRGNNADISVGVRKHVKKISEVVSELSEVELYEAFFDRFLMTDEQLVENGYPLWIDEHTRKEVTVKLSELDKGKDKFVDDANPFRKCIRCGKSYKAQLAEGEVAEKAECVYHWGKFWKKKIQGTWIPRYTCCDSGDDLAGCSLGDYHVTEQLPKSALKQFVEAPLRHGSNDPRSTRIVAFDCEMVYTRSGPAVARISAVDFQGGTILDEIIRPPDEVIDTNQRFSGLRMDEVVNAKLDLAGAHKRFFELVNRDSILIGHSLESDLKAMRIVHRNVIDTSVLYPHRSGPPFKRALKTLSTEVLSIIIQEDVGGHDSSEDARIALKLVIHKLKNGG